MIVLLVTLLIHKSAIITLIFLILDEKRIKIKNLLALFFGVILFNKTLYFVVFRINFFGKYSYLFEEKTTGELLGKKALLLFLLLVMFMYYYEQIQKKKLDKKYIFYRNIFLTGMLIYFSLYISYGGHISYRSSWYFLIHIIIILDYLIEIFKFKRLLEILVITILLFKSSLETTEITRKNDNLWKNSFNEIRRDDLFEFWYFKKHFHSEILPNGLKLK